ncbi:MAG TPA: hypothetical protein VF475_15870 [Sphingobium sp.]
MMRIAQIGFGICFAALIVTAVGAGPAMAAGVTLTNSVLVAQKTAAADGSTRITLVPAKRAVPGDHVVFRIDYRNEVGQPITGMVVSNPVPTNLVYRGPADGSPTPEVSVDGARFGSLASLTVAGRAARAEDVRAVRWQVKGAVPNGGGGRYAYEAIIK